MSKEIKLFSNDPNPDHKLVSRHTTIGNNISLVLAELEPNNDPVGINARHARDLVDEGRAIVWTVGDSGMVDFLIAPCYIFPDPEQNKLIPAIVADGQRSDLLTPPSFWKPDTLYQVASAIINLSPMYLAATKFTLYQLITEEQFVEVLKSGPIDRQRIVPIWDALRQ